MADWRRTLFAPGIESSSLRVKLKKSVDTWALVI